MPARRALQSVVRLSRVIRVQHRAAASLACAAIASTALLGAPAHAAAASTYLVGNATPLPAGAIRVGSLAAVPWSSLEPGSHVLVSPGTYSGVTTIVAQGAPGAPIVLMPFSAAQAPVLLDSIDVQHSEYLRVTGMKIQSPTYGGIILRNGSNHVALSYNVISGAPMGVNITMGAGTGNNVSSNTITGSIGDGIVVDVNANPGDRTLIAYNTIQSSGTHGIEIHASHYQIEHNVVSGSGRTSPGTSGIHLFSASAQEDSGDDNIVRYNSTYANNDTTAYDGNGIEVDHWCDHNTISFNTAWDNDGSGIIVYDGQYNLVEGNTLYGNVRDPGGTHAAAGGELVIGSSTLKRSAYNVVRDNLIVSQHAVAPAFHLDSGSLGNGNAVGPNLYYNTTGGKLVRFGDSNLSQTLAQVNAITGTSGNVIGMPTFVAPTQPLANGLRLAQMPGATGVFLSGAVDRLGQTAISGWSFFGAYFTHP